MQEKKKIAVQEDTYIAELSDEFINNYWIFFREKLSKRTQKEYFSVLSGFVKVTHKDIMSITQNAVEVYMNDLVERMQHNRLTYTTALMRVSVMRTVCEYVRYHANQRGIPYINHFQEVVLPDIDKTIQPEQLPSLNELNSLLEMTIQSHDTTAFLLFSFVIKCGLTTSEISSLNIEDLVLDMNEEFCIHFPEKKHTSRIIHIPKDLQIILHEYLAEKALASGPVFLNKHHTRLKVRDAERILNKYVDMGIENGTIIQHFTLQIMRHAAIIYMLKGGASENAVAQYTGITTKWLSRYRHIVHSMEIANAADYHILTVHQYEKRPNNSADI